MTDAGVMVAWSDDDAARGGLSCHDVITGEERWRVLLDAPIRAGITWLPSARAIVAVSVSGGVVAVDLADGATRWRAQIGDRTTAWVHAAPVDLGDAVAVGEPRWYAAFDVGDGTERWRIDRADQFENVATLTTGVVQDGTLVVPFSMLPGHTLGLDPVTGAVRWSGDGVAHHSPASDVVALPDGRDVLLVRLGGRVERVAAATGEVRWATRVAAAFVPGRPLVVEDAVVVTTALGDVHRLDLVAGAERWTARLPGDGVLAMGPYRRSGPAVPAGPVRVAEQVVQPTGDGWVHALDIATGRLVASVEVGGPITVPVVPLDGDVVVATAEGTLARIAVPAV